MSSIVLFWGLFSKSTNSESKKRAQAVFIIMFCCCGLTSCIFKHQALCPSCYQLTLSRSCCGALCLTAGWVRSRVGALSCAVCELCNRGTAERGSRGSSRLFLQWFSDSSAGEQLHYSIQLLLLLQLHSSKGILKFQFKETILKIKKLQEIFAHLLCGPQAVFGCRWFRGVFLGCFFVCWFLSACKLWGQFSGDR